MFQVTNCQIGLLNVRRVRTPVIVAIYLSRLIDLLMICYVPLMYKDHWIQISTPT